MTFSWMKSEIFSSKVKMKVPQLAEPLQKTLCNDLLALG